MPSLRIDQKYVLNALIETNILHINMILNQSISYFF